MGAVLPKPVTSVVVKRNGSSLFRVGFAEMNGWRKDMEDANVIVSRDSWGFFGVFDGHGGGACSKFIAKRLVEELDIALPADDNAVTELMLRLDQEYLDTKAPSGSTGTFAIVTPPAASDAAGKWSLRVGNIGDSRVLLGRADGTQVGHPEGKGTDGGLTIDHKPDHPSERERIERTGGSVQFVQGVARVNGDLAVSRSFGDGQYKLTGGPAQIDHPVSAGPEHVTLTCDGSDFLVLVCDGISEGAFPNAEVVKLAAEELDASAKGGKGPDPGAAAAAVCRRAIASGSQDNLSCMIVLLGGGEVAGPAISLQPGPFDAPKHGGFRRAYAAMAAHAGVTMAAALEQRFDAARAELAALPALARRRLEDGLEREEEHEHLRKEVAMYGDGPPSALASGSAERVQWFEDWAGQLEVEEDPDPSSMTRAELLQLVERRPEFRGMAQAHGLIRQDAPTRYVKVVGFEALQNSFKSTPALKWNHRLQEACGHEGNVIEEDTEDGTSQVELKSCGFTAWLPSNALVEFEKKVKVASIQELKIAVEGTKALRWDERMSDVCGKIGTVIREDPSDGTWQVRFVELDILAWFPVAALTETSSASLEEEADADESVAKRVKVA